VRCCNGFTGFASEIDRIRFNSSANEFIRGRVDSGHFGVEVDQDNNDSGQIAMVTAAVARLIKNFKQDFKRPLPHGNTAAFTAYEKNFSIQSAVNQAICRSADRHISDTVPGPDPAHRP
jgi:hypothetical protein